MKVCGGVAVCSAPVHIFRQIRTYENRLSVRQQETIRFPQHEFSWHFILGTFSEIYRQAEGCL